jgi:hypothetical protein
MASSSPSPLPYRPLGTAEPEIRLLTLDEPNKSTNSYSYPAPPVPSSGHLNPINNLQLGAPNQANRFGFPNQTTPFSFPNQFNPRYGGLPNLSSPSPSSQAPLAATLSHHRLLSCPPYVALSYFWGDPKKTRPISVTFPGMAQAVSAPITVNLHAALTRLRLLLQIPGQATTPIWTDALCINQGDNAEKAVQVAQMKRLYRRAARVYIFLEEDVPSAAPGSGPFGGPFGGGFGGPPIDSSSSNSSDGGGQAALGMHHAKRLARLIAPVSAENDALAPWLPEAERLPLQRERIKTFVRSLLAAQPQPGMFRGFSGGGADSEWFVDFAALRALFRNVKWWRRVWVVQEAVLARERVVVLGGETCEWEQLRLAQRAMTWMSVTQEEVVSDYGGIGGASSLYHHLNVIGSTTMHFWLLEDMYRKSVDEAKQAMAAAGSGGQGEVPEDLIGGIPLLDLLITAMSGGERSVESTNPRDRIYGLLGLVRQEDSNKIPISYADDMTLPKILFHVGKFLLERYGPVIMAYCQPTAHSPALPSWVPDMVETMSPLIGGRTEPGREVYHASRDTQWVPTEFPAAVYENPVISLRGVFIGTVAEVGSAFRTWPEHPQYFAECRAWFAELTGMVNRHGAADPQLLADCLANLWRVPVADRGLLTRDKREDAFRRGFEVLTGAATGAAFAPPGWVASESFVYRRVWLVYPCRAFVDNAGRPGLAPAAVQAGDQLVVFAGAPAPFVVRGRGDGRFTLLGSVYVYGRMDGEAFPGEPSLVDVQLC